jgi:hypothetical protein
LQTQLKYASGQEEAWVEQVEESYRLRPVRHMNCDAVRMVEPEDLQVFASIGKDDLEADVWLVAGGPGLLRWRSGVKDHAETGKPKGAAKDVRELGCSFCPGSGIGLNKSDGRPEWVKGKVLLVSQRVHNGSGDDGGQSILNSGGEARLSKAEDVISRAIITRLSDDVAWCRIAEAATCSLLRRAGSVDPSPVHP